MNQKPMRLLWVKSNLPLSLLIRWGLKEPCSHFAVVFDDKLVIHSDLMGVGLKWYPEFVKSHTVVHERDYDIDTFAQEAVYQGVLDVYAGSSYAYKAFFYFCWRALLWRILGVAMPEKNPYDVKGQFLCTQIAQTLPDFVVPADIKAEDLGIVSPEQLWLKIEKVVA